MSLRWVGHDKLQIGYDMIILTRLKQFSNRSGYSDDANNKYHVGTRLQLGSDLKFELTGMQETDAGGTLNQQLELDGAFNW